MSDTPDAALYGETLFGETADLDIRRGALEARYTLPPFNLWDRRQGAWQERRRAWLALGIASEVSREDVATYNFIGYAAEMKGVSVFDPVVCELSTRWFSAPGDTVLDPFAGGSVRGIVAALCGRRYIGIELRPEQVAANEEQADTILAGTTTTRPVWITGDAAHVLGGPGIGDVLGGPADLIFTCPPYHDLEVYSDDPADLSAMPWPQFLVAYEDIIISACEHLRDDGFAIWVIGDVRAKAKPGFLRRLPAETLECFTAAGLELYNDVALIDPAGTLPVRAPAAFDASRKLGKSWQYVQIYAKGDPRAATTRIKEATQ